MWSPAPWTKGPLGSNSCLPDPWSLAGCTEVCSAQVGQLGGFLLLGRPCLLQGAVPFCLPGVPSQSRKPSPEGPRRVPAKAHIPGHGLLAGVCGRSEALQTCVGVRWAFLSLLGPGLQLQSGSQIHSGFRRSKLALQVKGLIPQDLLEITLKLTPFCLLPCSGTPFFLHPIPPRVRSQNYCRVPACTPLFSFQRRAVYQTWDSVSLQVTDCIELDHVPILPYRGATARHLQAMLLRAPKPHHSSQEPGP